MSLATFGDPILDSSDVFYVTGTIEKKSALPKIFASKNWIVP